MPPSELSACGSRLRRQRGKCEHTKILGRLAGDGDFLHEGPLAVVPTGLVVAFVDVVGDTRLGEPLAQVPSEGLPVGVALFAAS